MARKVAVMGASGFVGTTLIEHLAGSGEFEVVPFIHRSGSAARLARHGLHSRTIDLLDRDAIKGALASFDVVVNCSRGDKDVMLTGLGNMLDACRHGVASRFVHLSSVAVYGDPPHPDSGAESAPAIPARESYGALKLEQDRMVDAAADHRLQTVILCPPNITGPYSGYLTDILGSIESGRFRLLDEGRWEVNVCDVRNLAEAIVCAMRAENTDRGRFFICDDTPFTWSGLCAELAPLCRAGLPVESIPSKQLVH
jgi:nucleoside-diphosphate-sugar epimerase